MAIFRITWGVNLGLTRRHMPCTIFGLPMRLGILLGGKVWRGRCKYRVLKCGSNVIKYYLCTIFYLCIYVIFHA
jgi:hypothetical protein